MLNSGHDANDGVAFRKPSPPKIYMLLTLLFSFNDSLDCILYLTGALLSYRISLVSKKY